MAEGGVVCYRLVGDELAEVPTAAATLDKLSRELPQGVYTTLRTFPGGRALHVDDHLRRLEESAALVGHPFSLERRRLRAALAAVLARAGFPLARLRLTVAFEPSGEVFVAAAPFVELPTEAYRRGVRAVTAHLARMTPEAKTTGFASAGAQARAAAPVGTEEVLLVNADGLLLEGTNSNFFAVLHGRLRTAGEEVLHGITRTLVLEAAEGLLPVELRAVHVADLASASEAFITSSSRGVLPLVAVDGAPIGQGHPGPVAMELLRRYQERVDRDLEPLGANVTP